MLKDYEYIFCLELHKKIKEKVKGKIFTTVKDNNLLVSIKMGKVGFRLTFENFEEAMSNGLTTEVIVNDVMNAYREYIDNLYFATETEETKGCVGIREKIRFREVVERNIKKKNE